MDVISVWKIFQMKRPGPKATVVILLLVHSPVSAAEPHFALQGGLRMNAAIQGAQPLPETVFEEQWRSQRYVNSLGLDLGVSKGPWAITGLATYGNVVYSCSKRYESRLANDPAGDFEVLHLDDCQGKQLRTGILGQYVVDVNSKWQGVVGSGVSWLRQTLQFSTEHHRTNQTRPRTQTRLESNGFELTILEIQLRWKRGPMLSLGPTTSFGWADDRFGSRFVASGGLRLGLQ